jgi:hypothetical protein
VPLRPRGTRTAWRLFAKPIGGAMLEASVGGQNFTYQAKM